MDEEEVELLSDSSLETLAEENREFDFMREIMSTPAATAEENRMLITQYKACAPDSKERIELQNIIVKRNMRLIISVAKQKLKYAT